VHHRKRTPSSVKIENGHSPYQQDFSGNIIGWLAWRRVRAGDQARASEVHWLAEVCAGLVRLFDGQAPTRWSERLLPAAPPERGACQTGQPRTDEQ
jgi:hypothetical protein